jgi:hypothetical protein
MIEFAPWLNQEEPGPIEAFSAGQSPALRPDES